MWLTPQLAPQEVVAHHQRAGWVVIYITGRPYLFTDLTPGLDFPKQRLPSQDRSAYLNMKRMTPEQLKTWRAAYGPKDKAFREAKLTGRDLVRWKFQRYAKNYLRAIKGVDENLARLRKALEDQGLADNTVFVYSSDQGFYIGDHGWYDKRWMYEESLKMPLIISWPGVIKPGSRNTDLVQNLDYAQTFLEMAGAKTPSDMQGTSLVPLLKGNKPNDWRKSIYYHYYEYPSYHQVPRHNGIRTERYKLIRFPDTEAVEFYDLQEDPAEMYNRAAEPAYKKQIATTQKQLDTLMTNTGVTREFLLKKIGS